MSDEIDSDFADFHRNATDEERGEVISDAIEEANEMQRAVSEDKLAEILWQVFKNGQYFTGSVKPEESDKFGMDVQQASGAIKQLFIDIVGEDEQRSVEQWDMASSSDRDCENCGWGAIRDGESTICECEIINHAKAQIKRKVEEM